MTIVRIASHRRLLTEFVASLIRERWRDAVIRSDVDPEGAPLRGAMVTDVNTGRWIFVSEQSGPDDQAAIAIVRGACAVLNLESRPDDFARALDALLGRIDSHVPLDMLRWIADMKTSIGREEAAVPDVRLTEREREVLGLVARGYSNNEIASLLTISVNTVRTHLHGLAVKLDAKNRVRVLANARALGLIESTGAEIDIRSA